MPRTRAERACVLERLTRPGLCGQVSDFTECTAQFLAIARADLFLRDEPLFPNVAQQLNVTREESLMRVRVLRGKTSHCKLGRAKLIRMHTYASSPLLTLISKGSADMRMRVQSLEDGAGSPMNAAAAPMGLDDVSSSRARSPSRRRGSSRA